MLLISTTNLDTGMPVVWNIGAIAGSGHPLALDTIRRVLLASAAIPGAFPPVLFDVTVDGRPYQELHVDGGAIAQALLYPEQLGASRRAARAAGRAVFPVRAWLIRNGRIGVLPEATGRRTLSIAQRSVATMLNAGGYHDSLRMYLNAERDGVDFQMTWIGEDFTTPFTTAFDRDYMRALFEYGAARMRAGRIRERRPPLA